MTLLPSKETSRKALKSHGWLGLAAGALMYWICLSGAIVVLNPDIARWEQPGTQEYASIKIENIERAYHSLLSANSDTGEHVFITLPTDSSPRAKITAAGKSRYINQDGTLGDEISHPWMDLVTDLHLYLHLPKTWGMIVVSIIGVILCALVVSGFLAHRRLRKDAFAFRYSANSAQQQTDVHNRLSVWLAPFHLMFGVTGAFFGLAGLMSLIYATIYFDGDTQKVISTVYGSEPELEQVVEPPDLKAALASLKGIAPAAEPFYITLEEANTPEQYTLIGATLPNRLLYAEQYRFDNKGAYLGKVGFSDGEAGRQAIFSVYRLHFGYFGPFAVQLFYVFLGLVLAVISVSGINIWLAKRQHKDYLNSVWTGIVWGTPFALSAAALLSLFTRDSVIWMFWLSLIVTLTLTWKIRDHERSKWLLCVLSLLLAVSIVCSHTVIYAGSAWIAGARTINISWLISAVFLLLAAGRIIKRSHRI